MIQQDKKKLKIHILATEGSPLNVTEQSIYGFDGSGRKGVGGAELGILTLCRLWHNAGHDVTFYNNGENGKSEFKHAQIKDFQKHEDRDILIIFRTPTEQARHAVGKKIFYSNDQYTTGEYAPFVRLVDKVVVISEFHKEYFKQMYGIFDTTVIDIPVRTWEYPIDTPKKKNSCIFTSVPNRGLKELIPIWKRIVEQVPDASLTITSDWSLWNGYDCSDDIREYRLAFAHKKNVNYLSAVKREELIKIQSEAEFHLYPCIYDELFCISVAESQVAGAIPITSTTGALQTTNRFGVRIGGHPLSGEFQKTFVDTAVALMNHPRPLPDFREKARAEFGEEKILEQWDKIFYG